MLMSSLPTLYRKFADSLLTVYQQFTNSLIIIGIIFLVYPFTPGSIYSTDAITTWFVARQVWTYWVLQQATLLFNSTATATRTAKKQYWIGWIIKTKNLHVHHAFLYISLPLLYDSDVNIPANLTSLIYGGRAWTQDSDFLFLFVNLDTVLWNLTPGNIRHHLANWTR